MSDNVENPKPPAIQELSGRIDKYEIVRKLGKGAMGIVYLAHDTVLDRDVALKVMAAQIIDDAELKTRFEREARAVAKMTHPNVVMVFDLGSHEGAPYIAMELLRGQDLSKAMRQSPPLTLERKVAVIAQVLAGLGHAHQAGIIHRDVKPANIFIGADNTVKIMDFGVARLTTASITGTGNIVGTADYMSPEQVQGAKVDGRSDLFAVGCMLYELVTGRRPFHADNLMAIFYKITHEEPDFALLPGDAAHQAVLPILRKSLAKRLEDRYQNAHDFASDLYAFLRAHATSASARQAIDQIAASGPPPGTPPPPLTDAGLTADPTVIRADTAATMGAPTLRPEIEPTAVMAAKRISTSVRVAPLRAADARQRAPRAPVRAAAPRRGPLWPALAIVAVLGGGVGFHFWQRQAASSPSSLATPSTTTLPVPATTLPNAVTPIAAPSLALETIVPAPPPTLASTVGPTAAALNAAQAAFRRGDYDIAMTRAQEALRDKPASSAARQMIENALAGQKAQARFSAASEALSRGDLAAALREAEAGRSAAPWDAQGAELLGRIRAAERRATTEAERVKRDEQQGRMAKVLDDADTALSNQDFDRAIALYDQVLQAEPGNARAGQGKTGAVGARAMAKAARSAPVGAGAVKRFVSGKTVAQNVESRRADTVPRGFEPSEEVTVHRGSRVTDLPGAILFEVTPEQIRVGEKYTVRAFFMNDGNAPIQLLDMRISTTVNGRRSGGAVPPLAKEVGPKQRALLLSQSDVWRDDLASWSMEIVLRSVRGDIYRNEVSWK